MSRTYKDRVFENHRSMKANPLGVCRCLQCAAVKRRGKSVSTVSKLKKHNRKVYKAGMDEKAKKGYYYA